MRESRGVKEKGVEGEKRRGCEEDKGEERRGNEIYRCGD